jgi:cytoskeletal protein RodZ
MITKSNDPVSPKVTETATEARQGTYGKPVFIVLICGMLLALLAWGGVEIWGESIDQDAKPAASTKNDPINAQPSGAGTFDNNPADGSSRPPETTDKSPTPSGSGSGPTQVTTPAGTEKIK